MTYIKALLIVIFFSQIEMGNCLKMYNSTLTRDNTKDISGLQLLEKQIKNIDWSSGLTVCTRFNYKKIIGQKLFNFGQDSGVSLTFSYPNSNLIYRSNLLWKSYRAETSISIDKWNHLCFALDRTNFMYYIYLVIKTLSFYSLKTCT